MTARPIGHLTPGTDAWTAARALRVGGSDIAAVMGRSPWESRFSLWHRKQGLIGPVEETEPMRWGTLLEPVVAADFARRHPEWDVRSAATFVSAEHDFQTAAPDRLLYRNRITSRPTCVYEGKTARSADGFGDPGTDEVPPYYADQVQWYLDCLGLDVAVLAVLIGGSDYREYQLTRDPERGAEMRAAAAEFIATIEAGIRPSIDDHDATYTAVREIHPDIEDVEVEVSPVVAVDYLEACWAETRAKNTKRAAVTRLADAMGTARRALYLGDEIAIRVPGRPGSPPHIRPSSRKAAAA